MPQAFEIIQTTAHTYAEALFALADERGETDVVADQLDTMLRMITDDPDFDRLFNALSLDDDVRRVLLHKILGGRVHPLILNTALVMNRKGRSGILAALCKQFRRLLNEKHGRRTAYVTSAVAIDDDQRSKLREQARRLGFAEPVLVEKVDPALLGGVVLQVGDHVIDTSVRLKLRRMRSSLRTKIDRQLTDAGDRFIKA